MEELPIDKRKTVNKLNQLLLEIFKSNKKMAITHQRVPWEYPHYL